MPTSWQLVAGRWPLIAGSWYLQQPRPRARMFAIMVRPGGTVVAIAGNLEAAAIPDLHAELVRSPGRTLDCRELRRVDPEAAEFLRRWQVAGGTLTGVSHLLALMLETEPVEGRSEPDDWSVTR